MYIQAVIWFLFLTSAASAAPVIGAVAAFASTTLGSIIVNAAIGIALSFGASLLRGLFTKKTQSRDPGTTVQLRTGGANPLVFPLGKAATAGNRIYYGTWSNSGGTPNEYLVAVVALSMIPVPGGMTGLWLNDQKVTVRTDLAKTEMGWPIQEYYKNGRYHAWVDFHDGTQTTPNTYLRNKFGSHPNYPWTSDMIGRGVAYVTLTCRYDKDGLWQSGYPSMLVELQSIPLYDPRKDSTRPGGSGSHRWGDVSTYEPSNNAMVRAYNVARGIYYGNEWVYGGQNWPAFRLPDSSWMTAMNVADTMVGGEPQFHGGGMVECDMEIATVLEELLRSSSALIAEVGGQFKVRAGAPGAPSISFTDADIVVTREQGYEPFPGMENTYNIAHITYTEPGERWSTKESPARRDESGIISDGNRELPFSVNLPWVLSNRTAQRIGKTALYNGRRFRRHSMYHSPLFWLVEPLDVVEWTSAHNSYVAKSFDVEQTGGNSALLQSLIIRENEPSDYVWNPIDDELPYEIIPIVPDITPPQVVTGWQVFPATIKDEQGRDRRPSIEVRFDGELTDIDRVTIQVRTQGETEPFFDADVPYPKEPVTVARVVLNGDFPPSTTVQVRARFIPFTDRDTTWSSWLTVTTPPVKLLAGVDFDPYDGVTGFDQLGDDLYGYQKWMGQNLRELIEQAEAQATTTADQELANSLQFDELRRGVSVQLGEIEAAFEEVITVAIVEIEGELTAITSQLTTLESTFNSTVASINDDLITLASADQALASQLTTLTATVEDVESSVTVRGTAQASPGGGWARWGVEVRTGSGDDWSTAGFYIDTNGSLSRVAVLADQFVVTDGVGNVDNPLVFEGGELSLNVANIGTVNAGIIQGNNVLINLNTGDFSFGATL